MTELERRLAAVELLLIDIIPWVDAQAIEDAAATIQAELRASMSNDEAEIKLQALELLTDGRRRFEPLVGQHQPAARIQHRDIGKCAGRLTVVLPAPAGHRDG